MKTKHYSRYWGSSHEKACILMAEAYKGGEEINKSIISGSDKCHTRKVNEGQLFGG